MSDDAAHFRLLPPAARELAEVIGWPAFEKLVAARGGRKFYAPKKAAPEHWLAKIIGFDALVALAAHYNGEVVRPPREMKAVMTAAREARVMELTEQGVSASRIAEELGIWDISVHRIRQRIGARPKDNQGSLF